MRIVLGVAAAAVLLTACGGLTVDSSSSPDGGNDALIYEPLDAASSTDTSVSDGTASENDAPSGDAGTCSGSTCVSFAPMQVLPFTDIGIPNELAIGDVNGDGRLDIILLENSLATNQQTVLLFLQDKSGTFPTDVAAAPGPVFGAWAVADVNHDRRADIVEGNNGGIDVRTGQTDGTFAAPVSYPLNDGLAQPGPFLTADFTGDGLTDVLSENEACIGCGTALFFFAQTAAGTLSGPTIQQSTGAPGAAGDVNGDGVLDVAGLQTLQNVTTISVTPGVSPGMFGPAFSLPFNGMDMLSWGDVAAADVNGDGLDDLVVSNDENNPGSAILVSLQVNHVLQPPISYPSGDVAEALAIGDVTGDGRNDVVVEHTGWSAVGVYAQLPGGTLGAETALPSVYGSDVLALGDLNGDGKLDIVTADQQKLVIFYNTH
jgi:hypothetical protein